jgi:hypothetical protein
MPGLGIVTSSFVPGGPTESGAGPCWTPCNCPATGIFSTPVGVCVSGGTIWTLCAGITAQPGGKAYPGGKVIGPPAKILGIGLAKGAGAGPGAGGANASPGAPICTGIGNGAGAGIGGGGGIGNGLTGAGRIGVSSKTGRRLLIRDGKNCSKYQVGQLCCRSSQLRKQWKCRMCPQRNLLGRVLSLPASPP